MIDAAPVIALLVEFGRPLILKHYRADSCIASTRIGFDVLTHFGVVATVQTVSLVVFNRKLWQRLNNNPDTLNHALCTGEYSVGVGFGYDKRRYDKESAFNGHLILTVPSGAKHETIIDLSLDQCARPGRGIKVQAFAGIIAREWRTTPVWLKVGNAYCVYSPIQTRPYQPSPDWIPMSDTAEVRNEITRLVTEKIEAGLAGWNNRIINLNP